MTIVLNEREWAEEMITSRSLGKKPYETLRRVARYYLDSGFSKRDVRKMLDRFLLQCEPTASLPRWSDSLDRALAQAIRYPAILIDGVDVTSAEMRRIDALDGKQIQRLAFTLLCLAKYWNAVSGKNEGWVNSKDSDIMRMANINTSIKRQSLMYYNLHEAGMVDFSKKVDNTNVRVCFIEHGEVVLHITDFRNLGYQYMMYHGGAYFVCANCGVTEKIDRPSRPGPKQKYCKECLPRLIIQNHVNKAMSPRVKRIPASDKKYTIYMHRFPDGKTYVGSTSQTLRDRWKSGKGYVGLTVGDAIDKAGWDNVRHFILFEGADRMSAQSIESFMIRKMKSYLPERGYNVKCKTSYATVTDEYTPDYIFCEVDGDGVPIS